MDIKIDNEIIATFSEQEIMIVNSRVICFKEWIKAGVVNIMKSHVDTAKIELDDKWRPVLESENTSIPSNIDDRIVMILTHPNYKSRAVLQAEEEAATLAMIPV